MLKAAELATIADGVANELFTHEIEKIARNIADLNTAPTTKRTVTLTFEFAPDEMREEVKVHVKAAAKLAPTKGYSKTVYCGKQDGRPTILSADPKQLDMFSQGVAQVKPTQAVI